MQCLPLVFAAAGGLSVRPAPPPAEQMPHVVP